MMPERIERSQEGARLLLIPLLQTGVLLACITSVTLLGNAGVIDAAAVTAIIGAIVGSIGVLAGVGMGQRRNGKVNGPQKEET